MKGIFITIEGGDGSGKSTQIDLIKRFVEEHGHDVILTREPGGTRISEAIREIILDKTLSEMTNKINDCYLTLDVNERKYYMGFFDIIVTLLEKNEGKINKEKLFIECYLKTSYSFLITSVLCNEDYLNHSDLSKKLNIKKNQLSNIIKVVSVYKLVTTQKVGREKFYFINELGEEFNEYYNKNSLLARIKYESKNLVNS
jgi:predicted transcriptional regulator